LRNYLKKNNLKLGPIYDLATLQVNPRKETDRSRLYQGKKFVFDELSKFNQNIRYFYMSTAEVYGNSPPPFKETSSKKPFNSYAKEKLKEEKYCLSRHGQKTQKSKIHVTGLRTFLIVMTNYDAKGKIISSRNYDGSKIILGAKLFEMGIKPPLVNKNFLGHIHLSEDVAGISLEMTNEPLNSKMWGQVFNCPGDPVSFGKMLETAFFAYHEDSPPQNLLVKMVNAITKFEIPRFVIVIFAKMFEKLSKISGIRDLSWRIPYLFQSYYLDSSKIEQILGKIEHVPTLEAVKIFTKSIRNGGPDDLIFRRYDLY
jgi:nucleoside-diphosphate-sugar epimerase